MNTMMKWLALLLSCVAIHAAEHRRTPPIPNEPIKASLSDVQTAIRTLVVLDVSVAIQTGAGNAETVAYWCRSVADAFASMQTNGNFLPSDLMNRTPTPLNIDLSALQGSIIGLYARTYEHRARAGVPPLDFLASVSKTFSEAIREGIRKGGKSAVVE